MGILNKRQQEEFYNEIMKLYDLAEGIVDDIASGGASNPEKQVEDLEPIIKQIGESADMMANSYMNFLGNNEEASRQDIEDIGKAVRRFCLTLQAYLDNLKNNPLH